MHLILIEFALHHIIDIFIVTFYAQRSLYSNNTVTQFK